MSLTEFLSRIATCLTDAGIPFMLTGSLASLEAGENMLDHAYLKKWISELKLEDAWAKVERLRSHK